MEYLLEVQWTDPTAGTVARILSALPAGVEQATGDWPKATSRAFCVLRATDAEALAAMLDAIAASGADAHLVTGTQGVTSGSSR